MKKIVEIHGLFRFPIKLNYSKAFGSVSRTSCLLKSIAIIFFQITII